MLFWNAYAATALTILSSILPSTSLPLDHDNDELNSNLAPRRNLVNIINIPLPILLPPTIQGTLRDMLHDIAPDADARFVMESPIHLTAFGLEDPIKSNIDLKEAVDHVFGANETQAGIDGWADTYIKFLIEAGRQDLKNLTESNKIIDEYWDGVSTLGEYQRKILEAYQNSTDEGTEGSNIGIDIKGSDIPKVDPLQMKKVEEWANGTAVKTGQLDRIVLDNYFAAKTNLSILEKDYKVLKDSNAIASQGYGLKKLVNSYPGVFNLSMVTGGKHDSKYAEFSPAWSATVIGSSKFNSTDAQEVHDNLVEALTNSTYSESSSLVSSRSTSTKASIRGSSTALSKSNDPNTANKPMASATTRAQSSHPATSHPASSVKTTPSSSSAPRSTSAQQAESSKARSSVGSAAATTAKPPTVTTTSLRPNPSTTSKIQSTGISLVHSPPKNDSLSDVPSTPLRGNLMILSLQEGSWVYKLAEYVDYARLKHPDIAKKYFGEGDAGKGPIGRRWSHLAIITMSEPNSTQITSITMLGKVFEVLPVLKTKPKDVNLTAEFLPGLTSFF